MTLIFDLPLQTINALFVAGGKDEPYEDENLEKDSEHLDQEECPTAPDEGHNNEKDISNSDNDNLLPKRTFTPVWKKDVDDEPPTWDLGDDEEEDETR